MIQDRSLIDEFIAESRDHLRNAESDFITLEKQYDRPDPALINRIFRAIHTIKGGAGFMGLKNINRLSHSMETILSMVRDGQLRIQQHHADILLEGIDTLSTLLDNIDGSDEVNIDVLMQHLQTHLDTDTSAEARSALNIKVSVGAEATGKQIDISQFTLRTVPPEHRNFYIVICNLNEFENEKGLTPVKLVKELQLIGTIVDGFLTDTANAGLESVPAAPLIYTLLFATSLEEDLIADAVRIDKKNIRNVTGELAGKKEPAPEKQVEPAVPVKNEEDRENKPAVPGSTQVHTETVRIRVDILDKLMGLAGELVLVRNQQLMHFDRNDVLSRSITQRLDLVTSEMQETIMQTRMQPIGTIFGKFTRVIRDLANKLGKKIEIEMVGNEVELDKTIIETLADPLTHLVRNCCDHGIEIPEERRKAGKPETGTIHLVAYHEGGQMIITVADDGKGINAGALKAKVIEKKIKTEQELSLMSEKELLSLIFLPGVSTAKEVTDISGRGVGMDVVKTGIERLGGTIELTSAVGEGTEIVLRLPLTLAIIPSLIVTSGNCSYAIPQINLEELVRLYDADVADRIECAGSREVFRLRDKLLPIVHLSEVLAYRAPFAEDVRSLITEKYRTMRLDAKEKMLAAKSRGESTALSLTFAVLKIGDSRFGMEIDNVAGTEEIVVKPMHHSLKDLSIYSGATVLGDGKVALILDVLGIARHAGIEFDREESEHPAQVSDTAASKAMDLLLFRSGVNEIFGVALDRIRRVERIDRSSITLVGEKEFITVDGISTRVIHLDRFLNVSPCVERDEMFLLLPKEMKLPCGVLVSSLVDIGSYEIALNTESYNEDGLKGSAIVKGTMTLIVDMVRLLDIVQSRWQAVRP